MELADAFARRRMVRSFSGRPVDPAVLDALMARATSAPTAGNSTGWDAVVLQGAEESAAFWSATTTERWRSTSRRWAGLSAAPVVVALFTDPAAYVARYAEPDKVQATGSSASGDALLGTGAEAWPVPYWFVDTGLVVMTLLVGAVDAGLGACFLGNFRGEAALCRVLGVPAGRRYAGAVLMGEPGGDDPRSASLERRHRSRASMVHRGRW